MKKFIRCICLVGLVVGLGACDSKGGTDTSGSSIESSVQTTKSSKKELSKTELFDQLPEEIKIVLYADVVDKRVKDYPGLEGLDLGYFIKDDTVFTQITSGVGTGHPVYEIKLLSDGVKPLSGSAYMGVSGVEKVPVDSKIFTNELLYDNYLSNKDDFEKASKKVKKDSYLPNVSETIEESTSQSTEEKIVEDIAITDDDKLNYFKNYVLSDTSPSITEFHKQQVNYGVDENHNKMIRYGGGLGAYATVEGSKIIYEIYSFGGVHDDGTVEKTFQDKAFYDVKTGEHGLLNN